MFIDTVRRFHLPVLLTMLLLVGCATSSPPVNFYTLHVLEDSERPIGEKGVTRELTIGLGPIELPEMLDRPQIITRTGNHRLQFAEFDRWAGSLKNDFSRILAENLSVLLNTEDIVVFPWGGGADIDYQVIVDVANFDAVFQENARLNARWKLRKGNQGKLLRGKRSVITERIVGEDYEAVVAALNRTLDAFSREIAKAIQEVASSKAKR